MTCVYNVSVRRVCTSHMYDVYVQHVCTSCVYVLSHVLSHVFSSRPHRLCYSDLNVAVGAISMCAGMLNVQRDRCIAQWEYECVRMRVISVCVRSCLCNIKVENDVRFDVRTN